MMWSMMWSLWKKDFKTYMADRQAIFTIFLMPVVISTILGFSLQSMFGTAGGVSQIEPLELAVVKGYEGVGGVTIGKPYSFEAFMEDLSENPVGARVVAEMGEDQMRSYFEDVDPEAIFFEDFLGSPELAQTLGYTVTDLTTAERQLAADEIAGIVVLPENFVRGMYVNLLTPLRSEVEIAFVENTARGVSSKLAKMMLEGFAGYLDSVIDNKNVLIEQRIAAGITLEDTDWGSRPDSGLTLEQRGVRALKPVDSKGYYTVAMMSMFLLFTAALGGYLLLEEKRQLTYDRQRAAGLSRWSILLGKLALIDAVALIQILLMIVWSTLIFRISWGSPAALAVITLATVLGIGGLGLLFMTVAAAFDNIMISKVFENGLNQVLALVGGAYIPIETMPALIQKVALIPINGVILKVYLYNMMGYSLPELMPYVGLILLNGLVFSVAGILVFRFKEVKAHVDHNVPTAVDAESVL
ncbi:ABC transporter permease [Acidaminobacter sp.]|uniref:ABC transporter permease n=1 Tax=Acidaminobacter sp. TaxID=1872102 RepID=UPI0026169661|nr:ABC transporter permease [Acidaminobacter sp.]